MLSIFFSYIRNNVWLLQQFSCRKISGQCNSFLSNVIPVTRKFDWLNYWQYLKIGRQHDHLNPILVLSGLRSCQTSLYVTQQQKLVLHRGSCHAILSLPLEMGTNYSKFVPRFGKTLKDWYSLVEQYETNVHSPQLVLTTLQNVTIIYQLFIFVNLPKITREFNILMASYDSPERMINLPYDFATNLKSAAQIQIFYNVTALQCLQNCRLIDLISANKGPQISHNANSLSVPTNSFLSPSNADCSKLV